MLASPPERTTQVAAAIRDYFAAWLAPRSSTDPRGPEGQRARRCAEAAIRGLALAQLASLVGGGLTLRRCAELIGVARSTFFDWWKRRSETVLALGRPARLATPQEKERVLECLRRRGPHVGVPTLERDFPELPRAELAALKRDYLRDRRGQIGRLAWTRVGAVWAMDFTTLRAPLDGGYGHVLVVRDLASGRTLCAEPLVSQDSRAVARTLRALFADHGAPLVLKCDNGSPLVAGTVRRELTHRRVTLLRSPPRRPQYNGACEAGMRVLKQHLDFQAERLGRNRLALEAARLAANAVVRRGSGVTADEAWQAREVIPESFREAFEATLAAGYAAEWTARGNPAILDRNEAACVDRKVIGRALVELALLCVRRAPIL